MQVLGVEHIDLTVADLDRSRGFYDALLVALGFRRVDHETYLAWSNGHLAIGLRAARDAAGAPVDRYAPGLHHLALRALARSDVDALHALLVERGVPVLDPPAEYPEYGPEYYAVFFADPDGNKLEYVHFPAGYWRRVQTNGEDPRPRFARNPAN